MNKKMSDLLDLYYQQGYEDGKGGYKSNPYLSDVRDDIANLFDWMHNVIKDMEMNDDGQAWKETRKLLKELE